jgi:hypothetical protein
MIEHTIKEVKRLNRRNQGLSIPFLQSKLKISHGQAKRFIEELKVEAEKRQKVSNNSRTF